MILIDSFRPTRLKTILTLIPFIVPFAHFVLGPASYFDYLPFWLAEITFYVALATFFAARIIAWPFRSWLENYDLWEKAGLFASLTGPTLPGIFLVALFYALIIYLLLSLISIVTKPNQPSTTS